MTADLVVDLGSFSSTSVEVTPVTDKGREFLGAVIGIRRDLVDAVSSVNLPKSKGEDFIRFAKAKGLTVG